MQHSPSLPHVDQGMIQHPQAQHDEPVGGTVDDQKAGQPHAKQGNPVEQCRQVVVVVKQPQEAWDSTEGAPA